MIAVFGKDDGRSPMRTDRYEKRHLGEEMPV